MATLVTRTGKGSPLTNLEVDTNFTNLDADIALRATIDAPQFTGVPTIKTSDAPVSTGTFGTNLATTVYVSNLIQDLNFHILPSTNLNLVNAGIYTGFPAKAALRQGGPTQPDIPSAYSGVNIGASDNPFANLFCQKIVSAADSIIVGTASLSGSSEGGIVLPTNTAIGSEDAVIPANLASTVMDSAFAYSGHSAVLELVFTYSSSATALSGNVNTPVALQSDGTVAPIVNTPAVSGVVAVYKLLISNSDIQFAKNLGYDRFTIAFEGNTVNTDITNITTRAALPTSINLDSGNITQFTIVDNESDGLTVTFNAAQTITNAPTFVFTTTAAATLDTLTISETTQGVTDVAASSTNSSFVGFIKKGTAIAAGASATVTISGLIDDFTGLVPNVEYYVGISGALESTSASNNVKIGRSTGTTTIFVYTTTTIDNYAQSHKKIELTNLSIGTDLTASSTGGITYDNTTGIFQFTPPKDIPDAAFTGVPTAPTALLGTNTTQLATTEFVAGAINNLIDSSPETLNTLNELAHALNDDAGFATTITDAINLKAPRLNPVFSGTPRAPTASTGTSTTQLATTAFVQDAFSGIDLSTLATKDSPLFTGIPKAPTAAAGTNSTQLATTAFVQQEIASAAPSASPAFTGVPTAPTAVVDTDTTQLATTAFVTLAVARGGGGVNIDGGLANSIRNTTTITLDGGGATG